MNNDSVLFIISELKKHYHTAGCELEYRNEPYKLLILARLSAQCTDAQVNAVAGDLFFEFKSLKDFAEADLAELERAVFSCGLYKTKAKNIKDMCAMLIRDYDSAVPEAMEELLKLPGIGRKIANLIRGDIFGLPAIVADTHCIRISNRLGLCSGENPLSAERQLEKIIPPAESNAFCHRIVFFGREYCRAKNPRCKECFLAELCKFNTKRNGVS
ncbi:MAG: endonuclease III [Oscillospiraceae bacterium]|nr:endonuclease III [Oscillospiraceae bacterium]